ncbi:MAG: outer membrane lipoprotein carrier protein LolA [Myxococcales bacterium]|nr:outer membrane lipoprotein carrier protein LolA [Myxococcales bacterium]
MEDHFEDIIWILNGHTKNINRFDRFSKLRLQNIYVMEEDKMKKQMIKRMFQLNLVIIAHLSISFSSLVYAQTTKPDQGIEQVVPSSLSKPGKVEPKQEPVQKPEVQQKADSKPKKLLIDQSEIIEKVQSFYAKAQDFQADFKQIYTYKIYGRKKLSTGKVFFKKPARMRWDYEVPTPRVFIADGQTLWVYEPEEAQVFKRDLSSAQLPVALRFMQGKARLDQEFKLHSMQATDKEVVELSLKPKSAQVDFKTLKLRVKTSTGEVLASTLVDATGNLNEISFVAVKVNQGLPNEGFSFTPPKGVRVIDENNKP